MTIEKYLYMYLQILVCIGFTGLILLIIVGCVFLLLSAIEELRK